MADEAFADWLTDPAWDMVLLGGVYLPGICTVESLEVGCDIDIQKKRKKEKARIRDNGLSPVAFQIMCEITAAEWPAWCAVLPAIKPKDGGVRTPLQITHPLVNLNGVTDIYVHKIHYEAPSARKGMRISIRIAEWFEEEKDAKPSKAVQPNGPGAKFVAKVGDVIVHGARRFFENAAGLQPGTLENATARELLVKDTNPANADNVADNSFGE